MALSRPRVAVITNVVPHYRTPFYRTLIAHFQDKITIFCQTHIKGMDLRCEHEELSDHVQLVRFVSGNRDSISWQFLPIKALTRDYDVYVFLGNPRMVSTVVYATFLRMIGKPVIIWGQLHTASSNRILKNIRLAWWKMFQYVLLYNDWEAETARNSIFRKHVVIGINNGLDQNRIENERAQWTDERLKDWRQQHDIQGKTVLLCCARLERKNRFDILIHALPLVLREQRHVELVIIGDGPERESLLNLSAESGISKNVRMVGAILEEERLAPWFSSASIFIHPGAIGLSLLHACGYGLPVITHADLKHQMPEFLALPQEARDFCFEAGNPKDLARKIVALLSSPLDLQKLSQTAIGVSQSNNTDVMATRFLDIVEASLQSSNSRQQN